MTGGGRVDDSKSKSRSEREISSSKQKNIHNSNHNADIITLNTRNENVY